MPQNPENKRPLADLQKQR